jgi:mannose-1-phosphate guanylyltransferase
VEIQFKQDAIMKAFLLAAGLGVRLQPITNTIPKCLIPIDGKPMLHHWLSLFKEHGITDILINLHHLPQKVVEYVKILKVRIQLMNFEFPNLSHCHQAPACSAPGLTDRSDFNITLFYEEELLGSAGTVRENADWVSSETEFIIAYADNLTNANLTKLLQFHRLKSPLPPFEKGGKGGILTMGLFHSDYPQACGIASLDEDGMVVSFVEKPQETESDLANAGIYVASPEIFSYIPEGNVVDLGHDVLPKLVGKMYGCEIDGYLRDIGTPENYKKAQEEWKLVNK